MSVYAHSVVLHPRVSLLGLLGGCSYQLLPTGTPAVWTEVFGGELGRWLETMKLLLVALKVAVSKEGDQAFLRWIAKEALYCEEGGFVLSPCCAILMMWLVQYMGGAWLHWLMVRVPWVLRIVKVGKLPEELSCCPGYRCCHWLVESLAGSGGCAKCNVVWVSSRDVHPVFGSWRAGDVSWGSR